MKVVVLGAAGKLGQRLVESCLARGHEVTAAMRNPAATKVEASPRLRVAKLDVTDAAALEATLAGHDAMVNAAGNSADGPRFNTLFDQVVTAAERVLGNQRRVWMLAGALVLDMPPTRRLGMDLPFVPQRYNSHLTNWRRLQSSPLDWALMCPGPMQPDDDGPGAGGLRTSVDAMPFDVGAWARYAPPIGLSLLLKARLPNLTVGYRGVADVIADNLQPGGPFSRKRVGAGRADPATARSGAT